MAPRLAQMTQQVMDDQDVVAGSASVDEDNGDHGGGGGPQVAIIGVKGMTCQSCVRSVTNTMRQSLESSRAAATATPKEESNIVLPRVDVQVSLRDKTATVTVESISEVNSLLKDLEDIGGFDAELIALSPPPPKVTAIAPPHPSMKTRPQLRSKQLDDEDKHIQSALLQRPTLTKNAAVNGAHRSVPEERDKKCATARKANLHSKNTHTYKSQRLAAPCSLTPFGGGVMGISCQRVSKPKVVRASFGVSGVTCTMCTKAITEALSSLPGVVRARVSLATECVAVDYDETVLAGRNGVLALVACVEEAGYGVDRNSGDLPALLYRTGDEEEGGAMRVGSMDKLGSRTKGEEVVARQDRDMRRKRRAFLLSLLGTAPIVVITMILNYIPSEELRNFWEQEVAPGLTLEALVLWILATPVQFGSGWTFYRGAFLGIRNGALGMDVLVAMGTTASYVYAVVLLGLGMARKDSSHSKGAHFFETSAVLISFVLLGKWMQAKAMRRTSSALTKLMNLQSKTALLVKPCGPASRTPMAVVDNDPDRSDGSSRVIREERQRQVCNGAEILSQIPAAESEAHNINFDPLHDPHEVVEVPIEAVQPKDIVKVLRGASVPTDGKIYQGEISVDESMITGESLPVLKSADSDVLGGTVCVEGVAFVAVTSVGQNTALAKIVRLVEEAQMNAAPIQEFADRVSGIFVPVVCLLSWGTFIVWYALCYHEVIPMEWYKDMSPGAFSMMFALSTLVISCPCALGLATPTAVMVGTGVGASNGILIKGGEQLQRASRISSVIFDKTGTLTKGRPCVTDFIRVGTNVAETYNGSHNRDDNTVEHKRGSVESLRNEDILWLLANLERNSEHPLAEAIVLYAESTMPDDMLRDKPFVHPTDFIAVTGKGASCSVATGTNDDDSSTSSASTTYVAVGNRAFFCRKNDTVVTKEAERAMVTLERDGKTAILCAINETMAAVLGISDEIKPDSAAAIHYLRTQKVDVWMLTGDSTRTAKAVSRRLGMPLDHVIAEALPDTKLQKVKDLQADGAVVAMVGDGINDSPALAQADVGIAVGTCAEIAAEAADMVLINGDIGLVCTAIDLARTIFLRIRINFGWAMVYNCVAIPIAMGVFYPLVQVTLPPTVAALAMVLSSLSVVASSLLLYLYKPPKWDLNRVQSTRFGRWS